MLRTTPIRSYLLVGVQLLCLGLIALTGPLIASQPLLFGLEALAGGLGLWAIWTMGLGNFNITPEVKRQARLVTGGPYRYIRHPMYSALLLGSLALVLDSFSPLRLAIWLVLLGDLLVKLGYEERMLSQELSGYSEHRRRSKRLVPFVF